MARFSVTVVIFGALISKIANFETTVPPEDVAEETQHAICKILTQEIQTSANATVKRQLKGVCTSKQIDRKFKQLEEKLLLELAHIKAMLTHTQMPVMVKTPEDYDYHYDEKALNNMESDDNIVSVTKLVFHDSFWSRTEILKLNNTVYTIKGEKVYTFYWEIPEIRAILRKNGIHIQSPNFTVLGHDLGILLYSNHLDSDYLGLQLKSSTNFLKKHKFTILDQLDSSKDINSQTLGGVSYGEVYRVPYAKLEERNYMRQNVLIVKLTILLNS